MKYSFVLIAYNEENNIAACIASITKQKQLGDDYEIIVADDGSRDGTVEIVKSLGKIDDRVKIIGDGKNHGRGYGRYTGAKKANGEFVAMVDADIVLPKSWLATCLEDIGEHSVAGGIAVPDGDVAYIYRRFKLRPKIVMGSTTITGNNGLYKQSVFSSVVFDKNLREGEDVDFNHKLQAAGLSSFCIPGLTVEHQEHKSFLRSMQWLYQSGVGATRQLIRFKEIRLPDLAFAATLLGFIGALLLTIFTKNGLWFAFPLFCVLGASLIHVKGKFYLTPEYFFRFTLAVATNAVLIFCYYVGRFWGFIVLLRSGSKVLKNTA